MGAGDAISQCLVSHIEIHITLYMETVFVCAGSQLSGDDFLGELKYFRGDACKGLQVRERENKHKRGNLFFSPYLQKSFSVCIRPINQKPVHGTNC